MHSIKTLAPAKINLSLRVLGKRSDGYHLLKSIVVFADHGDEVEVSAANEISLEIVGKFAPALAGLDIEKNLVYRAAKALKDYAVASRNDSQALGAHITLTKNLPIASGIGGGSADAAATLIALNKLWNLNIVQEKLAEIGLSLGSDVPVCINGCTNGKPVIMEGTGERLSPAELPENFPNPAHIILINPNQPLSTAEVFAEFAKQPRMQGSSEHFINDLEPAACAKMQIIADLLRDISATKNCHLARMSGSGATCFGIYASKEDAESAASYLQSKYPDMWCVVSGIRQ